MTGASGFVGACLARRLLAEGHELHLLLRRGHRSWRIEDIRQQVRVHEVDVHQEAERRALFSAAKPEWIFNLMAHGAYSRETDPYAMVQTNLIGTMRLLDTALAFGFRAFIHAGSSSEYGLKDHAPAEDEALQPNSPYAVSKAAATHHLQYSAGRHDAHVVTLRLYSVFGPFEEPTRLIPTLLAHGLRGRLPPLVDPGTARDFVYVEDVNDAFLAVAHAEHLPRASVFNVATGVQLTIGDVVTTARRLLDVKVEPTWGSMPARSWDTTRWVGDPSRLHRSVGWRPRHSFDAGLLETITWLRSRPALLNRYRKGARGGQR